MEKTSRTILLLDDDRDFLEMNRTLLSALGYRVVCYADARKELEAMDKERPDLVVTDLMMKSLDAGFSFARQLKGDPRTAAIPVIIITAVGSQLGYDFSPRNPADLAAMGADAYLEKPADPKALVARIEELLGAAGERR
jgi:CheY-like chemotaxis protein